MDKLKNQSLKIDFFYKYAIFTLTLQKEPYKKPVREEKMTRGINHFFATVPVAILYWVLCQLGISSMNRVVFLSIWFFGVFMDVDHISGWKYVKCALNGKLKVPDAKEWINYLHTWQALVFVIIFSVYLANYLIILSYIIHIFMDSFNRQNLKYPNSPMPTMIVLIYLDLETLTYWYSEDGEPDDLNLQAHKDSFRRKLM